jgi:hypothetical protein
MSLLIVTTGRKMGKRERQRHFCNNQHKRGIIDHQAKSVPEAKIMRIVVVSKPKLKLILSVNSNQSY